MKKIRIIFIVAILMTSLVSCIPCTTCDYHTTVTYHYEGDTIPYTVEHNCTVYLMCHEYDSITVRSFANTFDNGHIVELVYLIVHSGIIQESRESSEPGLVYRYEIMKVPNKTIMIDKVETVEVSRKKN